MSALAQIQPFISVEEYLEGEKLSDIRHEYVDGYVYAMAGASEDHNRIAGNIFAELRERLRGKPCEPFIVDMKLRVRESNSLYYPDVFVACDRHDNEKYFRERPTIIFEVLSPQTARIDQREKRSAYALLPSLKAYVIVSQEKQEVTVIRRAKSGQWGTEVISGPDEALKLPEIKVEIPFNRIYERTSIARRKS